VTESLFTEAECAQRDLISEAHTDYPCQFVSFSVAARSVVKISNLPDLMRALMSS